MYVHTSKDSWSLQEGVKYFFMNVAGAAVRIDFCRRIPGILFRFHKGAEQCQDGGYGAEDDADPACVDECAE